MTAEQIRKARDTAPFKPFRIHLSDQRRFDVGHPDFLWVVPGGRFIAVADEQGSVEIIDLRHVTSLKLSNGAET